MRRHPADAPRQPEVVLHIGSGKTGTSGIQGFLARRREALLRAGVLYPEAMGAARHLHLSQSVRPDEHLLRSLVWRRGSYADPSSYRQQHREALDREVAAARPERILFSDEGLYSLGPEPLARLRTLLDAYAGARTVLVYLRPQDEHLVSRYQQSVKTGLTERLADFAEGDHAHLYDYEHRLAQWAAAMDPARIVVRRFQPAAFVGGSPLTDFLDATGLDLDPGPAAHRRQNDSLDAESVELLRLLNLDAVEHSDERPGSIDNRALVDVLLQRPRGAVLTLPEATMERFAARWADGNAAVARRYLGTDTLFAPADRSSRTTTTEQRLSPDRADALLDGLAVPSERRARVRAIAEREAGPPGGRR
ncbi:MAG: hypothetical protein FWE71_09665 [Nocardioidaceae bacterium]|nr:hypothetical protein [Nocardioidaceae bacterium]MCL2612327.1 hypothetical protein [Nocardioidaceae bacterium]